MILKTLAKRGARAAVCAALALSLIVPLPSVWAEFPGIPETAAQKQGEVVFGNARVEIDASNAQEGYIVVKQKDGGAKPLMTGVAKTGGNGHMYALDPKKNEGETLPLPDGDGEYAIKVYGYVLDTGYALVYKKKLTVTLRHSLLPFLYPNKYVDYTRESNVAKVAAELAEGKTNDFDKLNAIYAHVVDNMSYDKELAKTAGYGYVPDPDAALAAGKGICFDYASVLCAMLRSQGIPAKLVIGRADGGSHAWVGVCTENSGTIDGAVTVTGGTFTLLDPTMASSGNRSKRTYNIIAGTDYVVRSTH
jgi:hypothetical protein